VLDPALTRPGRMGRYVWLRTPTKKDRLDIFDLYLGKVAHDPELDTEKRRDEIARITNGYSPAMIEQVCSMALTYAHHEGKVAFGWEHIVEAMTTIESGMAINIDYVPEETRAVAIHEAGHAVAGHAYMKGAESTRLSIRRRGEALGHHQALEKEERFSSWRSEEMARLIWTLGAMAAERVFYGENSTGVGGDVQSATARSAWMVGACAMAPERLQFADGFKPKKGQKEDDLREEIAQKYERIGVQIMNRAGNTSPLQHDPLANVLGDPAKRAMAAQLLGQAYVAAHLLIEHNKAGVEKVADVLVERRELHGDEILGLLESVKLEIPPVDPMKEETWPKL
jgi:ATP-dependent Zn protease